ETKSNNIDEDVDFNSDHVEAIILRAYEAAQHMVASVGMSKDLIKRNLFNIEESSQMAQKLLRLNILTESEILILDGRNGEDSDEEDRFNEADDEEDDCAEDDEEEGCTESDDDEDSTEDDDEDD
ncbi:unnamed protein product, partial [Rotaria magnacalcarata]